MTKELKQLHKNMKNAGWTLTTGRRCHTKCKHPDGSSITLPTTPSDRNYLWDIKRNLRVVGHLDLLDGIITKK